MDVKTGLDFDRTNREVVCQYGGVVASSLRIVTITKILKANLGNNQEKFPVYQSWRRGGGRRQ